MQGASIPSRSDFALRRLSREAESLRARILHGSDYPLPAINVLFSTRKLQWEGFVTREERRLLNEIYAYNPLVFDLVVKRTVRHPETCRKFPASVFLANPALGP